MRKLKKKYQRTREVERKVEFRSSTDPRHVPHVFGGESAEWRLDRHFKSQTLLYKRFTVTNGDSSNGPMRLLFRSTETSRELLPERPAPES